MADHRKIHILKLQRCDWYLLFPAQLATSRHYIC